MNDQISFRVYMSLPVYDLTGFWAKFQMPCHDEKRRVISPLVQLVQFVRLPPSPPSSFVWDEADF